MGVVVSSVRSTVCPAPVCTSRPKLSTCTTTLAWGEVRVTVRDASEPAWSQLPAVAARIERIARANFFIGAILDGARPFEQAAGAQSWSARVVNRPRSRTAGMGELACRTCAMAKFRTDRSSIEPRKRWLCARAHEGTLLAADLDSN